MREARTVAIAGAGIGGLSAALGLAQAGIRVMLLERAESLSEAGAGIQLSPNASRVLAGLGLDERIAERAAEPEALDISLGHSGKLLVSMPLKTCRKRFGAPYRTIHRADLQAILAEAADDHAEIDLMLGSEAVDFAVHANGVTVLAAGPSGHSEFQAEAFIGADGVHSLIRAAMPGGTAAKPSGRTAWRAMIQAAAAPPSLPADRIGLWLGAEGHLVHYPVRGGREINLVAIVKETRQDPWPEGWSAPGDPERLLARFQRWCEPVRQILGASAHWRRWAVLTVDPSGPMALGPVALLGDAAHAMAPYLAQGGAMAIEDAAVLAQELGGAADGAPAALARYQRRRQSRVRRVWRTARSNGELFHMGSVTGAVRNAAMIALGGRGLLSRYGWIYKWKP